MSTQLDMQQLNAFVDGELDLERQLDIEARLRQDAALRAQVDRLLALREAVRTRADYHAAPAALRDRIAQLAVASPPAPAADTAADTARGELAGWKRWFAWRPLIASAGLVSVLAVALNVWLLQVLREDQLEQEVVTSHIRATLTQRQVDVESSDHHTVKPWLSGRLDFSPPVQELTQPGSQLAGARVDYIDGRPVAALVYRHAGHTVDSFVWPTAHADTRLTTSSQRGFNVGHWSRAGMAHWVVSDLNPVEFAQLLRELGKPD